MVSSLKKAAMEILGFEETPECNFRDQTFDKIYFILHGSDSFEYDPEGDEEYLTFFIDRHEDLKALGHKSLAHLSERLDEEVFGFKRKEATACHRASFS